MDLPHDLEKKYYEALAGFILETYDKESFGFLQMSDRPDIISQDRKIGIEVTRQMRPSFKEKGEYFEKYLKGRRLSEVDPIGLERFRSNGFRVITLNAYQPGAEEIICAYSPPAFWISNEPLIQAISKKIRRINTTTYQEVDRLCLFVMTDFLCDCEEENMRELLPNITARNQQAEKQFDMLFINDWKDLHIYDFHTGAYERRYIEDHLQPLCQRALVLAKQGD